MIEMMEKQSYSGVLCKSCRQPIPAPTVVGEAAADIDAASQPLPKASVFNLRCRACDKERPYRRSDIVIFEGAPRPRTMPRPPSALPAKKIARVANA